MLAEKLFHLSIFRQPWETQLLQVLITVISSLEVERKCIVPFGLGVKTGKLKPRTTTLIQFVGSTKILPFFLAGKISSTCKKGFAHPKIVPHHRPKRKQFSAPPIVNQIGADSGIVMICVHLVCVHFMGGLFSESFFFCLEGTQELYLLDFSRDSV